jgi:uncharacterized membrane protein (UPF0127 family)
MRSTAATSRGISSRACSECGDVLMTLINERTSEIVARQVEIADTRRTRRRGLLGRDEMPVSSALMIVPCFAVHTAFMRFSIDVIFTSRDGRVVRIVQDLRPWQMAVSARARTVIEMPAGALRGCGVAVGDRLRLQS